MLRKKITHPFQLELLRQQKDKARIVRELKFRQRIYTFAELSEKERKRRFAFLIAEKQFAAKRSESSDDSELDSDSNPDVETNSEDSFVRILACHTNHRPLYYSFTNHLRYKTQYTTS
jgi:hypothetical protein